MTKLKIMILADVPVWLLPGLEQLPARKPYATWLESLAPELGRAEKLDIHWVVFCKEVKSHIVHECLGQTFHIFPRWKKSVLMLTRYYSEIRTVKMLYHQLQPDLVHSWGSEDVYGIAGSKLEGNVVKLFTLQGCLGEYVRQLKQSWLFKLQAKYESSTIRRFQQATAETPQAAELLKQIKPNINVKIVDYGVDHIFHEQSWTPEEKPHVVFVGAITTRKGVRELIEAFGHPLLRHVSLEMIGDGDLRAELSENSGSNVIWRGNLNRGEVAQRLSRAWCFVMPTYSDTGPTAIKEARVVGLPVITTDQAGASCYIESGKNGHVIESRNVEAISNAVLDTVTNLARCRKMGAYQWIETKRALTSSSTALAFECLYHQLVNQEKE